MLRSITLKLFDQLYICQHGRISRLEIMTIRLIKSEKLGPITTAEDLYKVNVTYNVISLI